MTAESCRKSKTNNQQLLRDKLKLKLKYEVNIRFETQIWKSGPDLKMKNLEIRSWIPGLNLEKNCLKPGNGYFLAYFNKSNVQSQVQLSEEHISRYPKVAKGSALHLYLLFTHSSLSSLIGNKTKNDKNRVQTSVQIAETKLCLTDGYYQICIEW